MEATELDLILLACAAVDIEPTPCVIDDTTSADRGAKRWRLRE